MCMQAPRHPHRIENTAMIFSESRFSFSKMTTIQRCCVDQPSEMVGGWRFPDGVESVFSAKLITPRTMGPQQLATWYWQYICISADAHSTRRVAAQAALEGANSLSKRRVFQQTDQSRLSGAESCISIVAMYTRWVTLHKTS